MNIWSYRSIFLLSSIFITSAVVRWNYNINVYLKTVGRRISFNGTSVPIYYKFGKIPFNNSEKLSRLLL